MAFHWATKVPPENGTVKPRFKNVGWATSNILIRVIFLMEGLASPPPRKASKYHLYVDLPM
jgi:hypothetical protein